MMNAASKPGKFAYNGLREAIALMIGYVTS
jgi:hypothetical protein